MHRNTFVLILLLTIFAAIVVVINLLGSSRQVPAATTTAAPEPPSASKTAAPTLTEYLNIDCGISFNYSTSLTKLETATGSAIFVNSQNPNESLIATCQKEIPRPALPVEKIEVVQIASVAADLYHDTSAKDGTPLDKLIFRHPKTKLDILLAGYGEVFRQVISSLRLE